MVYQMIMPIVLQLVDLELNHIYLVAAVEREIGVSFQARLLVIERGDEICQWVLHFSGGLTLRIAQGSATTFFEVLEGI